MSEMRTLEIARRLIDLGRAEDAARAYALALQDGIEGDPAAELEAAVCVLQFGREYRLPYTTLYSLHRRGLFREDVFSIMTGAFYEPNVKELRSRYERNCKKLKRYPYSFRTDFVPFEDLPILFYPYDEGSYIPYYPAEDRFGDLIDFKEPVIKHYFFKDLEDPILAEDVFSQYELEYLNDNVRKSEYVARENHVYLHYTDWAEFCAYLQCWNLNPILKDEKMVFLIEDEISQYPIDFKARFGIDYSQYKVKPIGIREVNRLIWHTQLSSHNGGDFFNEIFDYHPNLIMMPSMMLSDVEEHIAKTQDILGQLTSASHAAQSAGDWSPAAAQELYLMKGRTDKDILVGFYLNNRDGSVGTDMSARIVPALFFQPHFPTVDYRIDLDGQGRASLASEQYDKIQSSPLFRHFKYIKTFTPVRRMTTSYGASVRFMVEDLNDEREKGEDGHQRLIQDAVFERILNRSFMVDAQDRLFKDSILVRFEDGKLNPKATFTALAEFLDLPYTESMTYCSEFGVKDVPTYKGNVVGFDPAAVHRTYDDYTNDAERCLIEYFMRDAYRRYGYDVLYYDGGAMTEERIQALIDGCTVINKISLDSYRPFISERLEEEGKLIPGKTKEECVSIALQDYQKEVDENRSRIAHILMQGLYFVNRQGQPLRFMEQLELDPALLEQPLYH